MPGLVDNVRWSRLPKKQGRLLVGLRMETLGVPAAAIAQGLRGAGCNIQPITRGSNRQSGRNWATGPSQYSICLRREGQKATSTLAKRSRRRRGLGAYLSYLRTVHCGRATPWRGTITRLNMRTGRRPKFS